LALQETKLKLVMLIFVLSFGEGSEVEWAFVSSVCISGCLFTMWDKNKGNFISSFQGQGFLGVFLEGGVKRVRCIVLNGCESCILIEKSNNAVYFDGKM
jgi:hypothetical protein